MSDDQATGTVVCRNYTRGRRAPITISRIGPLEAMWGRQDVSVYLIGFPVLFLAVATVGLWWPLVTGTFPGMTGALLSLAILIGVPLLAGAAAAAAGLNVREMPRMVLGALYMIPRPGSRGITGATTAHAEPALRIRGVASHAWVLPDRTAELDTPPMETT